MPGWTRSSEWRIGHWVNDLGLLRLPVIRERLSSCQQTPQLLGEKKAAAQNGFRSILAPLFSESGKGGVAASQNKMARTKEAVRRAQRLGPDRAAAEERCRRRRAAIAKAARVMSVEEVEIATIEREVVHCPARAPS